jgi:hypothetical protein
MPLELSGDISFTDQDDIVPMPGTQQRAISNFSDFLTTYTLDGNDQITGINSSLDPYENNGAGFLNDNDSTLDTGNGTDVITGKGVRGADYGCPNYNGYGIDNRGNINTGGNGDDLNSYGTFYNSGMVSLGDGNDGLHAEVTVYLANTYWALSNYGTIEAGNGDDSLDVLGNFYNSGMVSLGYGNDSITINAYSTYYALQNYGTIETGDDDDVILSTGAIYNQGVINTGNGKDSLTAYEGSYESSGNVFLGNGEDYLKAFGTGYYDGGNDQDSLELPSGSYTIGISGAVVSFTRSGYSGTMQTFGFEKLIAGSTTYDFTSFSDELYIFVP